MAVDFVAPKTRENTRKRHQEETPERNKTDEHESDRFDSHMKFSIASQNSRVFLDHNATSPIADCVREMLPVWLDAWGNASSVHQDGRGPKVLLRDARNSVAEALGVHPLEVVFTSGGTEANNHALKSVMLAANANRRRLITTRIEHPSVLKTAEYLAGHGIKTDFVDVDRKGRVDLAKYRELLADDVALVSVMLANNESGSVLPVREMAEMAHEIGALFHTDAVQALGKIEINLYELGVDLASFSGHKFYALKGSGALFVRRGLQLESFIHGGGQERNRRGGTENPLAIASLGFMCSRHKEISARAAELASLRDHFEKRVCGEVRGVNVTGSEGLRLPNTSSLVIDGVDGETLLMSLDLAGFSVSTGSACSSGSSEPSKTLRAMGLSYSEAKSSLRVGLGWSNTLSEVDRFIEQLKSSVALIRDRGDETDVQAVSNANAV